MFKTSNSVGQIARTVCDWSNACERTRMNPSGHTSARNHEFSTRYKLEDQVEYFVAKALVLAVYGY